MIYVGIDPGKGGAIAYLASDDPPIALPMPVITAAKGRTEYNRDGILRILEGLKTSSGDRVTAVIEKQWPRQHDGKVQSFANGAGYGMLLMALSALQIYHQVVTPQQWRKRMTAGISGKDLKQKSLIAVKQFYPGIDLRRTKRSRKEDHNIAEAILMARFCQLVCGGSIDQDSSGAASDGKE